MSMQLCCYCRYDTFGIPRVSIHGIKVARLPPITPKNGSMRSIRSKTYTSMARTGGVRWGLSSSNLPPLAHPLECSLSPELLQFRVSAVTACLLQQIQLLASGSLRHRSGSVGEK